MQLTDFPAELVELVASFIQPTSYLSVLLSNKYLASFITEEMIEKEHDLILKRRILLVEFCRNSNKRQTGRIIHHQLQRRMPQRTRQKIQYQQRETQPPYEFIECGEQNTAKKNKSIEVIDDIKNRIAE